MDDSTDKQIASARVASGREKRSRRTIGAAAVAGGLVLGAAGCYGTPKPKAIEIDMSCVEIVLGGEETPLPDKTFQVELTAPEWADVGGSLPLNHLTITGTPLPDMELEFAGVDLTGLESFRQFDDAPFENTYFGLASPDGSPADLGSAWTRATGPVGSDGTVDFGYVSFADSSTSPSYGARCVPKPGEPTRLATIDLRQPDAG